MKPKPFRRILSLLVSLVWFNLVSISGQASPLRFNFGSGNAAVGYTPVSPTNIYNAKIGYGFEPGGSVRAVNRDGPDALRGDFCSSDKPFYFSVALPEGNYQVTVILGDASGSSTNTIKAELRRLMVENVTTEPGHFATNTFIVNLRRPQFPGGEVKLKDRERTSEIWAWDEKLTLEFNGSRPCVCALEVERVNVPTVFLLGDSTVCDQPNEPWNSWGQMLPRFFKPNVAIANHAESGETLKGALGAKRLAKVLSVMQPGDFLLIQFGHNDMKDKATNALAVYKSNLERFVASARDKGGIPILVTSMERKAGVAHDTLLGYPDTVREVAREKDVPLIDLHALSRKLYQALGTNLDQAFQDGTHHNNYGSYELAKCVAESIRESKLPLSKSIVDDLKRYDPNHPDSLATFDVPASPGPQGGRPLGD